MSVMSIAKLLQLRDQITNPKFCHVKAMGKYLIHNASDRDMQEMGLAGQKIRFTRLAAERVAAQYPDSEIEELVGVVDNAPRKRTASCIEAPAPFWEDTKRNGKDDSKSSRKSRQ